MGKIRGDKVHSDPVIDSIDLWQHTQTTLSLSNSAAQTATLAEGNYDFWSDVDCYLRIAPTATGVTTGNGYLLRAGNTVPFWIRTDHRIGGILVSGTGTLSFHRTG